MLLDTNLEDFDDDLFLEWSIVIEIICHHELVLEDVPDYFTFLRLYVVVIQ